MTAAADEVVLLVEELMPLLAMLWALVPSAGGSPMTGTLSHHKAGSPAPWHAEAAMTLYTITEEARRLEASIRTEVAGHPGRRRGGSDANTVEAFGSICRLAYGLPPESASRAARIVARWIRDARRVRDLGLDDRPQLLPVRPGRRRPPCPYCGTYGLRVAMTDESIWCINRACTDHDGNRPRGTLHRSTVTGDGMISWQDGRITRRRDLA
ncbi:hypothetical protein ACFYUV_38200 [Nonomuraea sp. NPDC003560]|uniref:hypothetical protein n=1 Tax=Nonomuraea sp. NPDC003560 TaxID=3364341 RepID=UPI0036901FFF